MFRTFFHHKKITIFLLGVLLIGIVLVVTQVLTQQNLLQFAAVQNQGYGSGGYGESLYGGDTITSSTPTSSPTQPSPTISPTQILTPTISTTSTPTPSLPISQNLLVNPGFESETTDWYIEPSATTTSDARTGQHALVIGPTTGYAGQRIPVSEGEEYIVNGWFKVSGPSPSSRLSVVFRDALGNRLTGEPAINITESEYTQKELPFTVPETATSAEIGIFKFTDDATLIADDLILTKTPEAVPTPPQTVFDINLLLHGIGTGGDSVSPNSNGNKSPLHPQIPVTIGLYDNKGVHTQSVTGTATYLPATGNFLGSIASDTIQTGTYLIKLKTPKYLTIQAPGIYSLTQGEHVDIAPVTLIVGDTNNDNALNILDYSLLMGCYSDINPPKSCTDEQKTNTDLNDDGNVNAFDYNLFLRNLSVLLGD